MDNDCNYEDVKTRMKDFIQTADVWINNAE